MPNLTIEEIVRLLQAENRTGLQNIIQVLVEPLKNPAKVFKVFREEAYRLKNLSPAHVKNMELKSGKWDQVDSVRDCTYVVKGSTEELDVEDQVLSADDQSKLMVYEVKGGHITGQYKNVYAILKIIDDRRAQWVLLYEKNYPSGPSPVNPESYLDVLMAVTQDVDNNIY